MKFLLRMVVSGAAIFAVAYLSGGKLLEIHPFWPTVAYLTVALALINAIVRPIVKVIAFPITLLTVGLFSLVINAGMLYLASLVVPGVNTTGFLNTVIAAVLISVANAIGSSLFSKE